MEDDNDRDWVERARENPELAAEVLLSLSRQPPAAVISPPVPVSVPRKRPRSRTITLQGIREEEAERQRTSPETPQSSGNDTSSRAKPPAAKRPRVDQRPSVGIGVGNGNGNGNAGGDSKVIVSQAGSLKLKVRLGKPIRQPQDQLQPMGAPPSAAQNSEAPIPLIGHDLPHQMPPLESPPAPAPAPAPADGSNDI